MSSSDFVTQDSHSNVISMHVIGIRPGTDLAVYDISACV